MDKKVTYEINQNDHERKSLRKKLMELKGRKVSSDSLNDSSEDESGSDGGRSLERMEVNHTEAGLSPEELADYVNQLMADMEKEEEGSGGKQPIMLQIPFFLGQ